MSFLDKRFRICTFTADGMGAKYVEGIDAMEKEEALAKAAALNEVYGSEDPPYFVYDVLNAKEVS